MISPDDARLVAEQLADVLQERGLTIAAPPRVLTVAEVAGQLRRSTDWVYAHAPELGGFRMGDGPRAPIGFDQPEIDAYKRRQSLRPVPSHASAPPPRRRRGGRTAQPQDLIQFEETP